MVSTAAQITKVRRTKPQSNRVTVNIRMDAELANRLQSLPWGLAPVVIESALKKYWGISEVVASGE